MNLRAALERYREAGELIEARGALSPRFEVSAALWQVAAGPAVLFADPGIVGNMLNNRRKLGIALGVPPDEVQPRLVAALESPLPPWVGDGPAPCQEVVQDGLDDLPIPTISEHDAGRYISAGVTVVRHPETGRRNVGIARYQVLGPRELAGYFAPTHTHAIRLHYQETGRPMPVAVCIGVHPAVQVASQVLAPLGFDEFGVAGALLGAPLRLVACRTQPLEVPAEAEIVIEGEVAPDDLVEEGPFGEFPGTYAPQRRNPRLRVTAVTRRRDALFQVILGGRSPEHLLTGGLAREAVLFRAVRDAVPGTLRVVMPEGGCCRFSAVLQVRPRVPGEARKAALAAFVNQDLLKHVTVVDEDIDPLDPAQIEWAVMTRARFDRDLIVVPGLKSNPVDPTCEGFTVSKLAVDATLPVGAAREPLAGPPAEAVRTVRSRWEELFGA